MQERPANLSVFEKFDNSNYWKLLIDFEKWQLNDPLVFDKESSRGYLRNSSLALCAMLLTWNQPLSLDYIIALHDMAYHDKSIMSSLGLYGSCASGVSDETFSVDGFFELSEKIKSGNTNLYLAYRSQDPASLTRNMTDVPLPELKSDDPQALFKEYEDLIKSLWPPAEITLAKRCSIENVATLAEEYLTNYAEKIKQALTTEEKLFAIVNFIKDMHQSHPFGDGNGRTFIFLLLNKLLMMNNLSPTIVEHPFRFTGYSTKELVAEVMKGQKLFLSLNNPQKSDKQTLLEYICKEHNFTKEELATVYLDDQALALELTKLNEALQQNDFLAVRNIIVAIPSIQQKIFLNFALSQTTDHQLVLTAILNALMMFRHYGIIDTKDLLEYVIANPEWGEADLQELLELCGQTKVPRDVHWPKLILNYLQKMSPMLAYKALHAAMQEATNLYDLGILNIPAYVELLQKYKAPLFDKITNQIVLSLSEYPTGLGTTLLKKHLYPLFRFIHGLDNKNIIDKDFKNVSPNFVNEFFFAIKAMALSPAKFCDKFCELLLLYPQLIVPFRKIAEKTGDLSQSDAKRFMQNPQNFITLAEVYRDLVKYDLLDHLSNKLKLIQQPDYLASLHNALELCKAHHLMQSNVLQRCLYHLRDAPSLVKTVIEEKIYIAKIIKDAEKALDNFIKYPNEHQSIWASFFDPDTDITRAKTYKFIIDKVATNNDLKKIILLSIIVDNSLNEKNISAYLKKEMNLLEPPMKEFFYEKMKFLLSLEKITKAPQLIVEQLSPVFDGLTKALQMKTSENYSKLMLSLNEHLTLLVSPVKNDLLFLSEEKQQNRSTDVRPRYR